MKVSKRTLFWIGVFLITISLLLAALCGPQGPLEIFSLSQVGKTFAVLFIPGMIIIGIWAPEGKI